jgi:hypothetical protein
VAREWAAGQSSGAGPCITSRPDPVAGIDWDTIRAPAADAGRRQARAARHLARVAGRRLTPTPRTAHGKPADRAGKTGPSLAPPPAGYDGFIWPHHDGFLWLHLAAPVTARCGPVSSGSEKKGLVRAGAKSSRHTAADDQGGATSRRPSGSNSSRPSQPAQSPPGR